MGRKIFEWAQVVGNMQHAPTFFFVFGYEVLIDGSC